MKNLEFFFNVSNPVLAQVFQNTNYFNEVTFYSHKKKLIPKPNFFFFKGFGKTFPFFAEDSLLLFLSGFYNYELFFFAPLKRKNLSVKQCFLNLNSFLDKKTFLVGSLIKKKRGGFTIALSGLLCFLPFKQNLVVKKSFAKVLKKQFITVVRFFNALAFSLILIKKKGLFLNLVLSRKKIINLLKKNFLKSA